MASSLSASLVSSLTHPSIAAMGVMGQGTGPNMNWDSHSSEAIPLLLSSPRSERRAASLVSAGSPCPTPRMTDKEVRSASELFDFILDNCMSVNRVEENPLSLTKRAMIQVVTNQEGDTDKRYIVRVSVHAPNKDLPIWSASNACERIMKFNEYWVEHRHEVTGIVPILAPPVIVETESGKFMVERYAEIVFDREKNLRKDLLALGSEESRDLSQPLNYVRDVAKTLAGLHRHGWCHMDVSLENVALSATQAYLIDFESCLKFAHSGFVKRSAIKVPLKLPFVPPEHFLAGRDDYVSLCAYDVWGWGLLLYEVIFQTYLFELVDTAQTTTNEFTGTTYAPNMTQVQRFIRVGFKEFMKTTHPAIYGELYGRFKPKWLKQARDLFERIFVCPVRRRLVRNHAIKWVDEHRISCEQVLRHPLWRTLGLTGRSGSDDKLTGGL